MRGGQFDAFSSFRTALQTILCGAITVFCLVATGCAPLLRSSPSLPEVEQRAVSAAYAEKIRQAESCRQFEADVSLRFDSLFKDAVLSGILLAKTPQSVKFVGLTPFGQPLAVFALAGQSFIMVDVPAQKAYEGTVDSAKVATLFPFEKLERIGLFSLLCGVPEPGEPDKAQVSKPAEEGGERYLLSWPTSFGGRQQVAFSPAENRVHAYELLDEAGFVLLRASYASHLEEGCGLPQNIVITGEEVRGRIELRLERIDVTSSLKDDDFRIGLPVGFVSEVLR